jgi:uncharacterized membrane protein YdjX (TVP38/TMEM64 family)
VAGIFWQLGGFLRRHDFLFKTLAMIVTMVAFVVLFRALPMEGALPWLQEKVDELGPWGPVVFVVLFICLTAVLLPGVLLNVASGALFGPFWGGVFTSIGSTSAAAVSFLIGRYLAHDWVARKVHRYPRLHAVYDALGKEESWKIVAAVRLSHSMPFGLQNFLLGVSPVRFMPYLLTTWLITLPGIFFFAYLGYLAGTALSPEDVQAPVSGWQWLLRAGGLRVAGGAVFYLGRLAYRAIKERTHIELDESAAGDEPDAPRRKDAPRSASPWPWGTAAALVAAFLFLGGALWCYWQRDQLRDLFSG